MGAIRSQVPWYRFGFLKLRLLWEWGDECHSVFTDLNREVLRPEG